MLGGDSSSNKAITEMPDAKAREINHHKMKFREEQGTFPNENHSHPIGVGRER
jgi:hypothetical protein